LYEPSVGYNEPVREIQILFVIALPYRCWRDLLLEMLARYQMSSAENRSPFTYVIKVRDRESSRCAPDWIAVGTILIDLTIDRDCMTHLRLDDFIERSTS